jgi:SAM-dependent methyltransferase
MSRFALVESGELLGPETETRLARPGPPVAVRLLDDAPPFRDYQIFGVTAPCARPGAGLVLCRADGGYALRTSAEAGGAARARVVTIEHRGAVFHVGRPPFRWLSPAALARTIRALEILNRFRHPLTPPLWLGDPEACLDEVRAKYDDALEVRQYARYALAGPEPEEIEFVRAHVKPGGRLLDVGCGAGREAIGFARAGYRVTGIDLAPAMIEAARRLAAEAGLAIEFRVQNVLDLDAPPASFDGAFFGASLHHVPGRARRIAALARIGRALTPDGVLLVTIAYDDRRLLSRSRLVDLCRRAGARLLGPERFSEPGDSLMRDVSETSDPRTWIFFHNYSGPDEARAEIEAAGFEAQETAPGWWVCRLSARVA